jgi:Transcriptional regulator
MVTDMIHRKDRLIITSIDIIDELGIQGLSTREIAKRQGVTEATLFRHYKSKNDLIIAVLDCFSQFDSDIFQSTQYKELPPTEAITYMITVYAEYYENYPAITSILHAFDVLRSEPGLMDKINDIFHTRSGFIRQLVVEAQSAGEIASGVDSENFSDMLWGLCREISLKWRIDGRVFPLKERILSALNMVLDAYKPALHA